MMPLTDLFGHELHYPSIESLKPRKPSVRQRPVVRRADTMTIPFDFVEVMDMLKAPFLASEIIPEQYRSDIGSVQLDWSVRTSDEDEPVESAGPFKCQLFGRSLRLSKEIVSAGRAIPCEMFGTTILTDANGHDWSDQGALHLAIRLFWRSWEEFTLHNNELEKWNVLKWIFRPAIRRHFVWLKSQDRSVSFAVHEADDPFSFHNCCLAVGMDEDVLRKGVRRNLPAALISRVEDVVLA